ncbi:thiol:disulfide interchange protein [Pasteurellaceae bacterium RH1A]|nr:thiol:disulfide interchange protein [Pasteurellaceae bacterium RH1A]
MKKLALKATFTALAALFALNVQAQPQLGKEYVEVRQVPSAQKEVIEFFSFYCPHCYSFEFDYKIPAQVKEKLPQDAKLIQYHVNFLGSQSENLTRAWALAMALGMEDKVKTPLFEAAQANSLKSMDDIRQIFLDNGVSAEQFDGGINSFAVNGLVNKQVQLAEEMKIQSVPTFFINQQYQVNNEGLDTSSVDAFVKSYVDTIEYLIKK